MAKVGGALTRNVFSLARENVALREELQDMKERIREIETRLAGLPADSPMHRKLSREELSSYAEQELAESEGLILAEPEKILKVNGRVELKSGVGGAGEAMVQYRLAAGKDPAPAVGI